MTDQAAPMPPATVLKKGKPSHTSIAPRGLLSSHALHCFRLDVAAELYHNYLHHSRELSQTQSYRIMSEHADIQRPKL